MKEFLSEKNVEFQYNDISDDLKALGFFLRLRDASDKFDEAKKRSAIGIPCIEKDGEVYVMDIKEFLNSL